MKQYCRYCVNCICGDFNYCDFKNKVMSDNTIKTINKCKNFQFCQTDALGNNSKGYQAKTNYSSLKRLEQLEFF